MCGRKPNLNSFARTSCGSQTNNGNSLTSNENNLLGTKPKTHRLHQPYCMMVKACLHTLVSSYIHTQNNSQF